MQGPALAQGGVAIRDPFAWREALSPPAQSPATSARNSGSATGSRRGGSGGSGTSTPCSATPPLSPAEALAAVARALPAGSCGSGSSRSNLSARSGGSGRSARSGVSAREAVAAGYLPGSQPYDMLSARTTSTPESSARTSEFVSVYEASLYSARNSDFGTVYEEFPCAGNVSAREPGAEKRRHKAFAAAMDVFAQPEQGGGSSASTSPAAAASTEASLDPRQVFSAARHGRHREVEASLIAGFEPAYCDQFGNQLFHVACQNGNKRIAKLAIKYGGDMDAQNFKGNTGLHFLFAYGFPEIAEYFIEKGAIENIPNEVGKTAREGIR